MGWGIPGPGVYSFKRAGRDASMIAQHFSAGEPGLQFVYLGGPRSG
jgi:hypothetical protein